MVQKAEEETIISSYKEKIELMKVNLRMQNKDFSFITTNQIKGELDKKENKSWVSRTEMIIDKDIEKVKLTTKEGYIFYITDEKVEYKGKGEVIDTSELEKDGMLEMIKTTNTKNGQKVKITNISGKDYYKIKYQIGSEEEWNDIESGEEIEVRHGETLYAKLVYGSDSGVVQQVSIDHTDPIVVASDENTSNVKRKTRNSSSRVI